MPAPNEHYSVPVRHKAIFDAPKTLLSKTETTALNRLLVKHADAFSEYKGDIGGCTLDVPYSYKQQLPPPPHSQIKQAP